MIVSMRFLAILLCFPLLFVGCAGTSTIASNNTEGEDVSEPNDDDQVGTQASKNIITESGAVISQSQLTENLDSITTGSGEILVNLGAVVSTLGEGVPIVNQQLALDETYLTTTLQGVSEASTGVGTTVVSAGSAIQQLDALPIFVQLNNHTGLLTYTGETVSSLGGEVESLGEWLTLHTSESGGLYGLSEHLSAMTAPVVIQANDMIDLKGNALILFEDLGSAKTQLPKFVYVSGDALGAGTKALLMDTQGVAQDLGTVFVGENGITALLLEQSGKDRLSELGLDTGIFDQVNVDELSPWAEGTPNITVEVEALLEGDVAIVAQSLGDMLNFGPKLDDVVNGTSIIDRESLGLPESLISIDKLLNEKSQRLSDLVDRVSSVTQNKLLEDVKIAEMIPNNTLSVISEAENKGALLNSLKSKRIKPLLE